MFKKLIAFLKSLFSKKAAPAPTEFVAGPLSADGGYTEVAADDAPRPAPAPIDEADFKLYVDARAVQVDVMLHRKVGDIWKEQGVDPLTNENIRKQYIDARTKAEAIEAHFGKPAPWRDGSWKQTAADNDAYWAKRNEAIESDFVIGGGKS